MKGSRRVLWRFYRRLRQDGYPVLEAFRGARMLTGAWEREILRARLADAVFKQRVKEQATFANQVLRDIRQLPEVRA